MPSNNTGARVHYWQGKYGHLGNLISPGGWRSLAPWIPFSLDNGAFGAYLQSRPFDAGAFEEMLDRCHASRRDPLWVAVPDVVEDREATLESWQQWESKLRRYVWPLAFVVQDGMTPTDVPEGAAVVFVGGSTEWKRMNIATFCAQFPCVHVGRINTGRWLWHCHHAGVESCDGTGWFRGDQSQLCALERYLKIVAGHEVQHPLFA